MATIGQLRYLLSQLRQKRHFLEKRIEQIPRMLPACLILRYRQRHSRSYESIKKLARGAVVKSYAYLTFVEAGQNRHRYVQQGKIGEVAQLTEAYKSYSRQMQQIRQLNKRIVELLDTIAALQTLEVKDYVFTKDTRAARPGGTERTKQVSKRKDKRRQ